MSNKEKDKTNQQLPHKNQKSEESELSFDEKWNKTLIEVENSEFEEAMKFFKELEEEERIEEKYIKKYGKEPETRTPDGKVNKKWTEYVLRRDFGLEPDNDSHDAYESFSWDGLTGEEAFIAYWNCE